MKIRFFIPFAIQLLLPIQSLSAVTEESTGIFATVIKSVKERRLRAPKPIQKLAFKYAKSLCRSYNLSDWTKILFKRVIGYLTVYDGPPSYYLNAFNEYPDGKAFSNKGIHFPKNSFKDDHASSEQRFGLAHEVVHAFRKPIFRVSNPVAERDLSWFKEEYTAQSGAIKILFKLKDDEALSAGVFQIFAGSVLPYYFGARDAFFNICENNPDHHLIEKLRIKLLEFAHYCKKDALDKLSSGKLKNNEKQKRAYETEVFIMREIIELFSNIKKYKNQTLQMRLEEFEECKKNESNNA